MVMLTGLCCLSPQNSSAVKPLKDTQTNLMSESVVARAETQVVCRLMGHLFAWVKLRERLELGDPGCVWGSLFHPCFPGFSCSDPGQHELCKVAAPSSLKLNTFVFQNQDLG